MRGPYSWPNFEVETDILKEEGQDSKLGDYDLVYLTESNEDSIKLADIIVVLDVSDEAELSSSKCRDTSLDSSSCELFLYQHQVQSRQVGWGFLIFGHLWNKQLGRGQQVASLGEGIIAIFLLCRHMTNRFLTK